MTIDLRLGDCLKLIRTLADKSIDAVITSPPFNLGNAHHTGNKRHNPYDDAMPEPDYQNWQIEVLKELYRVLRDDGHLFYQHKNRIKDGVQISPYAWLFKTPFIVKQELVWFNGSQNFDKCRFYPMTERVYWLAKSPKSEIFNAINHHDFFNKSEWKPVGTAGEHTRAFPEQLVTDLVLCIPDCKLILDPYMGSGTVGKVCVELNHDFMGFEINPEYYAIAETRIADSQKQMRMGFR